MSKLMQYRCHLILFTIAVFSVTSNTIAQIDSNSRDKSQAKLLANVAGHAIYAADIDAITAKSLQGISDPQIISLIRSQALNELSNEYLASDAFEKSSLSKDPIMIRQLERLQRQVLMNFYLSNKAADIPKPDPRKIESYLQKHTELVAGRQMHHFNQIVIDSGAKVSLAQVKELVNQDPSLLILQKWLAVNRIPSQGNNFWRVTDQINQNIASRLNGLQKGGVSIEINPADKQMSILKLYESYPDPASPEEARASLIKTYEQDMRNQIARNTLLGLRSNEAIQIYDDTLKVSNPSIATSSYEHSTSSRSFFLLSALVIWIFSLPILVPAAITIFYRQRIAHSMESPTFLEANAEGKEAGKLAAGSEQLEHQSHTRMIRRVVLIPCLLPVIYFLLMPLSDFFQYPPAQLSLQTTFILVLAGLLLGSIILVSCMKVTPLHRRFKSGWLGLCILMSIELVFFLFGIHA